MSHPAPDRIDAIGADGQGRLWGLGEKLYLLLASGKAVPLELPYARPLSPQHWSRERELTIAGSQIVVPLVERGLLMLDANCSTLLAGKMASPAAIAALEQLLADKGARASDVGTLKRGTFYFGSAPHRPYKIATSLCLSYHPSTPPSEAEVLDIARRQPQAKP